jgi:hypothetical protein
MNCCNKALTPYEQNDNNNLLPYGTTKISNLTFVILDKTNWWKNMSRISPFKGAQA